MNTRYLAAAVAALLMILAGAVVAKSTFQHPAECSSEHMAKYCSMDGTDEEHLAMMESGECPMLKDSGSLDGMREMMKSMMKGESCHEE